jgi:hypothetical protein
VDTVLLAPKISLWNCAKGKIIAGSTYDVTALVLYSETSEEHVSKTIKISIHRPIDFFIKRIKRATGTLQKSRSSRSSDPLPSLPPSLLHAPTTIFQSLESLLTNWNTMPAPQQQHADENDESREAETVAPAVEPLEIEHGGDESEQETRGLVSSAGGVVMGQQEAMKYRTKLSIMIIIVLLLLIVISLFTLRGSPYSNANTSTDSFFPEELLLHTVYDAKDFENEWQVTPPYWEDVHESNQNSNSSNNSSLIAHLGPCYLPHEQLDWQSLTEDSLYNESADHIQYVNVVKNRHKDSNEGALGPGQEDLSGLCRPGFIIIGAGKCGTSSLYHYLVGHPRVLPAKNKQIHYFKYWSFRPMKWYLSNFPPAKTFLSHGALMTGEASPGYLVSFCECMCIRSILFPKVLIHTHCLFYR